MYKMVDQIGNKIDLPYPPKRIISLVPSQTELLYDLGLDQSVVGITKFCVHPDHWRKSKAIIGGTKNFHFDTIEKLKPDLIIGNKEENYLEGISELQRKYPVWMSDINTFDDAISMILAVSFIVDREAKGKEIVDEIQRAFEQSKIFLSINALYLMWREPWMGAATQTFINCMMEKAGMQNVLANHKRYPELSALEIQKLDPKVVLLSTEPYPFVEKHISEVQKILPEAKILLVDGEMFSWYGSRMRLATEYFNSLNFFAVK